MSADGEVRFQGVSCSISIARPRRGVVLVRFEGRDVGELGEAPFREIEKLMDGRSALELFIDARAAKGATTDVSGQWAQWLGDNKSRFRFVNMLVGTKFIQLSAEFVRKFANLGEKMRIFTDVAAFESELASAVADEP